MQQCCRCCVAVFSVLYVTYISSLKKTKTGEEFGFGGLKESGVGSRTTSESGVGSRTTSESAMFAVMHVVGHRDSGVMLTMVLVSTGRSFEPCFKRRNWFSMAKQACPPAYQLLLLSFIMNLCFWNSLRSIWTLCTWPQRVLQCECLCVEALQCTQLVGICWESSAWHVRALQRIQWCSTSDIMHI